MDELEELRRQVEKCTNCELYKKRNKAVFGEGPKNAEILLIGLGPGYYENLEGKPFVGPAGKLLNGLLTIAGWKRSDVYITNIMKSYLPENKATDEQIESCTPYLDRQIDIIKPRIIVLLGNVATKYIFKKYRLSLESMHHLHGKIFLVSNLLMQAKIIPMYHPAAALRNPSLKDTIEKDWKQMSNLRS